MKIVKLSVENIKRLVAVEITPTGNFVQITGANSAGKTSVLDSIFWALAGTKTHQSKPIRNGHKKATVKLDLGTVVVTREFKVAATEGGERVTTSVKVENRDGSRFPSPQGMLDSLLDSLSFDPLAFAKKDAKDQYEVLKQLCGLNFDEIDKANDVDYAARTELNRSAKENANAASMINVPEVPPTEKVNVTKLVIELGEGEEANAQRREEVLAREKRTATLDRKATLAKETMEEADRLMAKAVELGKEMTEESLAIHSLPPLPAIFDPVPLRERITNAEQINKTFDDMMRKAGLSAAAEEAKDGAEGFSDAIVKRKQQAKDIIAATKMPIEGLNLENGQVVLNGIPFDQASDAEQLRVSCAIAMRGNHKLRVIRVRDGSLLDEKSLKLLSDMADDEDYQLWLERVDTSGKIGFVIEDGSVLPPREPFDSGEDELEGN